MALFCLEVLVAHTWRGTCVCLSTGSYVSPIIYNTQKGKASNTWFLCLNGVRFLCQIITPLLKWVVLVSVLLTSNTNRFLCNHFLLEVLMSFTVVKNIISVFPFSGCNAMSTTACCYLATHGLIPFCLLLFPLRRTDLFLFFGEC